MGAFDAKGHNSVTWKVVRRSGATLAVASQMTEPEIQKLGEWSSKAYKTYVDEDEVERLRKFVEEVDDSSDSDGSLSTISE